MKAGPFSLNEIAFYAARAAFGAGAPWGVAEDAAKACVRLAREGADPAPVLARALEALEARPESARLAAVERDGVRHIEAEDGGVASALYAGPALIDWRAVRDAVRLGAVDGPALCEALIRAVDGAPVDATFDGCAVDAGAWETVQRFFRQSLVPASAASRDGAGAGLLDTD
jgi:hypothetical protein